MCYLGNQDIFLLKYNSSGSLLWTRQTGTTSQDEGYGVAISGDGFIYVTGDTYGALNGQTSTGYMSHINYQHQITCVLFRQWRYILVEV